MCIHHHWNTEHFKNGPINSCTICTQSKCSFICSILPGTWRMSISQNITHPQVQHNVTKWLIILLLLQLYNSLWVLACSIISFHCFLSCVICFQSFTPIFLKKFLTSSSHLTLGLPFGLVTNGFHLYMVLATLSMVILSTCPNQPSYISYYIFVINRFFQFFICFESPLSVCLLFWLIILKFFKNPLQFYTTSVPLFLL